MTSARLPFEGLKVLDCASYIAAPAAATVLADFGADVIKVEPPEGDPYRGLYQFPGYPPSERNFPWDLDSRNKRSLAIDLKRAEGVKVIHRLAKQADVFITNMPLAARERLALGYETIGALNPRLIYASFTAYGETGPEAEKTGFDSTAFWARSGLMDMVRADHLSPPTRSVAGMGDHPSAMALYGAIVTALYERERTGKGGLVSTSLLANGLWANGVQVQAQLFGVKFPLRQPREKAPNPIGNIYCCRDRRWLTLTVLNEARQTGPLFEALGLSELLQDPRFATQEGRRQHHVELIALFDKRFAERDLADWRVRLDAAGITFGVIGTLGDIDTDEQMRAVEAVVPFADGSGETVASPIHVGQHAKVPPRAAPALGEHSAAVLREAGYTDGEIRQLRESGVLPGSNAGSANR